ncbi:hypothetical protein LINPERPRIM_LOCUS20742 [Linum perenne]
MGFNLVNFTVPLIHTGKNVDDEPYIGANLAKMVYYVEDIKDKGWSIPVHLKPRDLYDMGEDVVNSGHESELFNIQNLTTVNDNSNWSRPGLVADFD